MGYGSFTTAQAFSAALTNSTAKQQADFNLLIQPLLNAAGINDVPGVHTVSCTV